MAQFKWMGSESFTTTSNMTKTGGASDYVTLTDDSASTYLVASSSANGTIVASFLGGLQKPSYDAESQVNIYIMAKYGNSSYRTLIFYVTYFDGGTPTSWTKTITTDLASTATVYSIALTGTDLVNFNSAFAQAFQVSFSVGRDAIVYDAYLLLEKPKITQGLEMGCSF